MAPPTPEEKPTSPPPVAVIGATGYVGGRLVPHLLEQGIPVRAIGRSLAKLQSRPWAKHSLLSTWAANALEPAELSQALAGCQAVYYLMHSMNPSHQDFAEADRQAAMAMANAAQQQGLSQIIYLSGLGEQDETLSHHLQSRAEVADILREGPVPVTVLRAAMIIGSGSASFEILRYLVERLPVMMTPRWVSTPCQPIAIRNVIAYLTGVLHHPQALNETFDIGCTEVLTYRELLEIYAEEAGLGKRWIVPVPVFTPKLSSYWIHLVTPVPAVIAQPLAEGLKNPVLCQETRIRDLVPQELLTCREAIRRALRLQLSHDVATHWTDAGQLPAPEMVYPGDPNWSGGTVYQDRRHIVLDCSVATAWQQVTQIGGENGWYYGNALWRLRGLLDRLLGGVGVCRGRRHPQELRPGDALDVWRVITVRPEQELRLLAEMKMPGLALLCFDIEPVRVEGKLAGSAITQTAWYVPSGLTGLLYWWLVLPLHNLVFSGMLKGMAKTAQANILSGPMVCTT